MTRQRNTLLETTPELLAESLHVRDLIGLVQERARREPDRTLLHFLADAQTVDHTLSCGRLHLRARAIGAYLQSRQLRGERALLLFPPGLAYVEAFYGCVFAGVLAVPAYPPNPTRLQQTLPRLLAIVRDSQPGIVLTTTQVLPLVQGLAAVDPAFSGVEWCAVDAIPDGLGEEWVDPVISPDSIAFLQYTSGSTADPKGVMVSHRNLLYNAELLDLGVGYQRHEKLLLWLPTFHDMGLVCALIIPLYKGLDLYLMSPMTFLQRPMRWLQAMAHFKATQTAAPNFAYQLCVRKSTEEQRAALDLSRVRVAAAAAEPIRKETMEAFTAAFEFSGFRRESMYAGYGLAEATLKVSGGAVDWLWLDGAALEAHRVVLVEEHAKGARSVVSCGHADGDTRITIVNPETMERCNGGEIGEVWVAGQAIARGYWGKPELSADVFTAYIAEAEDGPYLRTGDLGFLHEGELYVTGRLKDLIILDGTNYYPQDIEWTVQRAHPEIRSGCCAAFSIEHGGEERLVVAAELSEAGDNAAARGADVKYAVRHAIAESHQLPLHDLVLLKHGALPKTSSGKLQRFAARQGYIEGTLEVIPA